MSRLVLVRHGQSVWNRENRFTGWVDVALTDAELPGNESLEDVEARLLPYWFERIVPQLAAGLTVLVGAHGNSLRALVKHIEGIPVDEVVELEIATGVPRLYECSVDAGVVKVSSPVILTEPAANVTQ